jgi:hypothetical protein
MIVNIFEKNPSVFKVINQGAAHGRAARLRMVSVIKAIIKPPPNQGDDCWHFWKNGSVSWKNRLVFSKIDELPFSSSNFEN